MKVSNEEVMNAILNNDTARAAEMLEGFDLLKDGTPPPFHFRGQGPRDHHAGLRFGDGLAR